MDNKKSLIIFMTLIFMIIGIILIITKNMYILIPDYKNTYGSAEMRIASSEEVLTIQEKMYKYLYTFTKTNSQLSDGEKSYLSDDIVKKCLKLLGNVEDTLKQIITKSQDEEMIYILFQKKSEQGAILLYSEDNSKIYFYDYRYNLIGIETNNELLSVDRKKTIINKCKEKIRQYELDFLYNFEPDIIWRDSNNIYVLKDTKNNILVNYSVNKDVIGGFSIE